jgi:flavin reductase (DIM6/NTAB) family NADH-FMN oxidoreductase RutF
MRPSDETVRRHLAAITRSEDPPLFVVTVDDGTERSGCVVGFVTQCSIFPERLLVCLSELNHTFAVASRATALAVALLRAEDESLARRFGEETGDAVDKFAGLLTTTTRCGAPVIAGARPWVAGAIVDVHPLGDHVGFVIEATESGGGGRAEPLRTDEADLAAAHPPDEILPPRSSARRGSVDDAQSTQ